MRIMLDTNVLISMFLFPSAKMNRLKTLLASEHKILLSSYIVPHNVQSVERYSKTSPG
jgi:predicted nucleic acid-binding protein